MEPVAEKNMIYDVPGVMECCNLVASVLYIFRLLSAGVGHIIWEILDLDLVFGIHIDGWGFFAFLSYDTN